MRLILVDHPLGGIFAIKYIKKATPMARVRRRACMFSCLLIKAVGEADQFFCFVVKSPIPNQVASEYTGSNSGAFLFYILFFCPPKR